MAFNTKLKLDNQHAEQQVGTTLTLSGDTRYAVHPNFTGNTQIVDKNYVDDKVITATGSTIYNLASPASVTVGGISAGTTLTGKTSNEILKEILVPLLQPSVTPQSNSISFSIGSTVEVGCTATFNVISTFSQGSVTPVYCGGASTRSGIPNHHCFNGACVTGCYACTALVDTQTTTAPYVFTAGANSWCSCVFYDAGSIIKDSVGNASTTPNAIPNPLGAGSTSQAMGTITGIYPYFYGSSTGVPTPGSALLIGASKVLADSNGQINITYGVQTSKYFWFATPVASTTKQGWFEGPTNKGNIGTGTDLFNAPTTVSVDSPSSCWTSQSYKFYITNYSTSTSGNAYCMTNTPQQ
jgi:hypothetical protein